MSQAYLNQGLNSLGIHLRGIRSPWFGSNRYDRRVSKTGILQGFQHPLSHLEINYFLRNITKSAKYLLLYIQIPNITKDGNKLTKNHHNWRERKLKVPNKSGLLQNKYPIGIKVFLWNTGNGLDYNKLFCLHEEWSQGIECKVTIFNLQLQIHIFWEIYIHNFMYLTVDLLF